MSKEPKRNVYVGHRYVPKIMGEWDKKETYEGLSIVTHEGTSYTSKKRVPVGIDILNKEYWVVTGNYNAQVETYRQEVRDMQEEVDGKAPFEYVDQEIDFVKDEVKEMAINVNLYSSLTEAIQSDDTRDLLFPAGVYNIKSPIKAILGSSRRFISSGKVIFNYASGSNDIMIDIELNGNDLEIEGDFTCNGNNQARQGLQITNDVVSMEEAASLKINKFKSENMFSSTVGKSAGGIAIKGGFDLVHLIDSGAKNISRGEGIGIPGSQGSDGLTISHYGLRAYARMIIIDNPIIDTITSEEQDESSDNVDCDGIKVFAPVVDGNVVNDSVAFINGGRYIDCRGRSIKSQMAFTTVNDPTFIRGKIKSIRNGSEVDFQYGNGTLNNFTCIYNNLPNGETPLGPSFKIAYGGIAGRSNNKVSFHVDEGKIINNISTDNPIPYLFIAGGSNNVKQSIVSIDNIKCFGNGRISRVLSGSNLNDIEIISMNKNYFNWITSSLIHTTGNFHQIINLSLIKNGISSTNPKIFDGGGYPIITALSVDGFEDNQGSGRSQYSSDIISVSKVKAKNNHNGGTFVIDSDTIIDGQTKTFEPRGYDGHSIYFISSNINRNAVGMFSVSGSVITPLSVTDNNLFEIGMNENPDVSGKINLWITDRKLNIKNMFGSNRVFTVASIG